MKRRGGGDEAEEEEGEEEEEEEKEGIYLYIQHTYNKHYTNTTRHTVHSIGLPK